MFHFRLAVLAPLGCLMCGCSAMVDDGAQQSNTERSYLGPTSSWDVSLVPWASKIEDIRNRAYSFCARRHADDERCNDIQDQSIKTAVVVERTVQGVLRKPDTASTLGLGERFAETLVSYPKGFADARAYCFDVYRDAGSADARSLGPCMASIVGWDYFGFLPVP